MRRFSALALIVLLHLPGAAAQEAIHTGAATQPSPGHSIVRQQFSYVRLRDDPTGLDRRVDEFTMATTLTHGLTSDLSFSLRAPLIHRDVESSDAEHDGDFTNVGDLTASLKWRFLRRDTGPIDTIRAAVFGGLVVPTFTDVSAESWDPFIGAVVTTIRGRHGLTLQGQWRFSIDGEADPLFAGEGAADLFRSDASYVYRLDPAEYGAGTDAALYAVMELSSFVETNGDHEMFLAPGLLYEAQRFALEASVQIPVAQSLDHRPETSFTLTFGVRFLF